MQNTNIKQLFELKTQLRNTLTLEFTCHNTYIVVVY